MELSILTNLYRNKTLDEVLKIFDTFDVHSVELGAGGYPGKDHCNPDILLSDKNELKAFKKTLESHNTTISALSAHGNALHPDKAIAKQFDDDFKSTVRLAGELGVDTVVTFAGCPGDSEKATYPNWVTCPWPDDFLKILDWQWNEKLIPYWEKAASFAKSNGVTKIAFEMHPGFCVYNPETLIKLRNAVGDTLGANFDPSHLIWQGIDPVAAIRELSGMIYHFHAKDTKLDKYNTAKNGVLDTKHYSDELHRAWVFRTVGYGNDESYWKDMVSNLRLCGYDKVLSIEHEDSFMSIDEGLEKAVNFLKRVIMTSPAPTTMSWA